MFCGLQAVQGGSTAPDGRAAGNRRHGDGIPQVPGVQ